MSTATQIQWRHDVAAARSEAKKAHNMVLIEVFSPKCISCQNMEERTWSDESVQEQLETNFVPVQIDVLQQEDAMKPPLLAFWTPTVIAMCPDGNIHRKWMGFLPPRQFLGELALARVDYAMARQDFAEAHEAAHHAVEITEGDPLRNSEAHYFHAVAAYKKTGDQNLLIQGWKKLLAQHPDSEWAQKVDFAASL